MTHLASIFAALFALTSVACGEVNHTPSETLNTVSVDVTGSEYISAFLDTIAYSEGTNDQYNTMFTGKMFTSYAVHPGQKQCTTTRCSDGAGRYQLSLEAWNAKRIELNLQDFSPENQDKAVVQLLKDNQCTDWINSIGDEVTFNAALYCVNHLWLSLLGGPFGQPPPPKYPVNHLYEKFLYFLGRY
jgi:muramidase (phage lysozyme)